MISQKVIKATGNEMLPCPACRPENATAGFDGPSFLDNGKNLLLAGTNLIFERLFMRLQFL